MFHVKYYTVARRVFRVPRGLAGVVVRAIGSGRVDAIGTAPGAYGECKGGTSAKVRTNEVDGVKGWSRLGCHVGIAWPRTWIFTRRCVRTWRCGGYQGRTRHGAF